MKREEELLAQALERYWDWRWENLPSREEILDMHRFSPEFLRNMENLEKKAQPWKRKRYTAGVRAAGLLLVLAVGLGAVQLWRLGGGGISEFQSAKGESAASAQDAQGSFGEGADQGTDTTSESSSSQTSDEAAGGGSDQADGGTAGGGSDQAAGGTAGEGSDQASGGTAGEEVDQEDSGSYGESALTVSWQADQPEGDFLETTLENTGDQPASCSPILRSERLREGEWETIWQREESWESWILDPQSARQEEISLGEYGIDSPGEYRLVREVDGQEITVDLQIP